VVAWRPGGAAGGDVGDQVGADASGGHGGAEAAAELGQGRRLAVELAGQDRAARRVSR
jgi:hypothetical protein